MAAKDDGGQADAVKKKVVPMDISVGGTLEELRIKAGKIV